MPSDPQTLSQMLQWSLDHTDLGALHEKAEAIRSGSSAEAEGTLSAEGNENDLPSPSAALPGPTYQSADKDPATLARLRELSDVTAAM